MSEAKLIPMELSQIVIAETSDEQIIVLKERDGDRSFPIVIGLFEAAAIDRKVKNVRSPRPLTHDLLESVICALDAQMERIVVTDLRNNTFYANLVLGRDGSTVNVDARPSDAIALAIQMSSPIFVSEKVLKNLEAASESA